MRPALFASLVALSWTMAAPAPDDLTFEVASVKPSGAAPDNGINFLMSGGPGTKDPEHLRYVRVSMLRLIATTFQVQADQISGPDWVRKEDDNDRFEIDAKIQPGATRAQMNEMMRNLLKERFGLAYHTEKKDFELYEVVVAKSGAKLQEAEVPAEIPTVPSGALRVNAGKDGYPVLPAGYPMAQGLSDTGGQMFISVDAMKNFQLAPTTANARTFRMGFTRFTFRMVTLDQLIRVAQMFTDSPHVVDHTGLTGKYDVKIAFGAGTPPPRPGDDTASEPAPDVFSAFEKQLGLKFQKTKAPLDVIVIDHIEKTPTEN